MTVTYGKNVGERYLEESVSTNVGECCQSSNGPGNHILGEQIKKWGGLA